VAAEGTVDGCITASDFVNGTLVVGYSYRKDAKESWLHFVGIGDLDSWFVKKQPYAFKPALETAACSIRLNETVDCLAIGSPNGRCNVIGVKQMSHGERQW
jgi:hypothetical protein